MQYIHMQLRCGTSRAYCRQTSRGILAIFASNTNGKIHDMYTRMKHILAAIPDAWKNIYTRKRVVATSTVCVYEVASLSLQSSVLRASYIFFLRVWWCAKLRRPLDEKHKSRTRVGWLECKSLVNKCHTFPVLHTRRVHAHACMSIRVFGAWDIT